MPKLASIYGDGFDIAVLTHQNEGEVLPVGASPISETDLNSGLFLISKDSPEKPRLNSKGNKNTVRKSTRNRKRVIFNSVFAHNGNQYSVNPDKSGLYVEMLLKIIEQFEIASSKWGRVFVLRFDLHQDIYMTDNKHITNFRKRLFQKLKREYGFNDIGYCWVREQERAKSQHYHFVMFLDGRLIRHSKRINDMIKKAWEKPTGGFYVPVIRHPYHFVNCEQIKQEAIYRVSYLAKARGKGYRPPQTKDFQTSRMKI